MSRDVSYSRAFNTVLKRDLQVAFRHRNDIFNPLMFFFIVVSLFPLGIGPEPQVLARIAPGIIWVAALLSAMLSLERLFKTDYADGSLEQMMLCPQPLSLMVLAKVLAHWIVTGVPLIVASPLLATLLHLESNSYGALMSTLALGTPVLSLLGAIGAALTVGLRKGGVLISLLILPLYIPVLIFATSAIDAAGMNLPYTGHLSILAAMLVGALVLAPVAIGASLRVSTN
ncbi:heme exporter protein CcmB [Ferrimonas sp. YFM]|uniref:heme exporter protein CcmB n=1 Tax=Ferrimonas sp. YFM TaxID=3028878 RepID=UPI0025737B2A|nr:heme exporter protein CcmB [Ferrimonas sp. YFM]BDY03223.1 heme exporter protein B [Ferrimonas sp. YFM]